MGQHFKVMIKNKLSAQKSNLAKISFNIEGEMKTFFRQKKGERIHYSGPEFKKKLDSSGRRIMKTGKNLGLYR